MFLEPGRQNTPTPTELAAERQQLETEVARRDVAAGGGAPVEVDPATPSVPGAQLASGEVNEIPYATSFPAVQVAVAGIDQPASAPVTDADEPSEGASGTDPHAVADTRADTTEDEPATAGAPSAGRDSGTGTSSGSTQGNSDSQTTADSSDAGTSAAEDGSGDDSGQPVEAGSGETVYHVYAGSYGSRSDADRYKEQLATFGFQATLIVVGDEPGADYLLRIATLEDYAAAGALRRKLVDSGFESAFATRPRR